MSTLTEHTRPYILLNGRRLSTSRTFHGLTPLQGLKITWGAKDWYSNIEPSQLTLTLIDPFGDTLETDVEESQIEVRRALWHTEPANDSGETVLFRGTVKSTSSRLIYYSSPITGKNNPVWETTLTAVDPLGKMAQDRSHGPSWPSREYLAPHDRMHWGPSTMRERRQSIDSRSPVPIVWEPTNLDQYDDYADDDDLLFYWLSPVTPYEKQANVSVLTVLRNTARIGDVTNRPFYFPDEDRIRLIKPVPRSPIAQGVNGIAYLSGQHLIPGDVVAIEDDIRVSTTATDQVTRAALAQRTERRGADTYDIEEIVMERTAVTAAAQLTVQLTTDYAAKWGLESTWADAITELIENTYGRQTLAPLIYEQKRTDPDGEWFNIFVRTTPLLDADEARDYLETAHLVGSLTNWAPRTGPFSIVGGELTFTDNSWRAISYPANVGTYPGILLGDLISDQTIAEQPPHLFVADYQKLTYH